MGLRNARPLTFWPKTACDSADLTNGPEGGMTALQNLVTSPSTDKAFVPRPAAVRLTNFPGFSSPGFISALLVVGDIAYGMIKTARNSGNDEPFVYNIATNTFLTVSGITAANTPASPLSTGDWTPPIIAVVGTRIIVCHPGFAGASSGYYFGWFDISALSYPLAGVNLTSGSNILTTTTSLLGIQPGLAVTGPSIPAGTVIKSIIPTPISKSGCTIAIAGTNLATIFVPSGVSVAVGTAVSGNVAIPSGATVSIVYDNYTLQLSAGSGFSDATNATVTFSPGNEFIMSANATGNVTGGTATLTGGTPAAPQWGAGNTAGFALPSVPVAVAQMAGSAYYAVGNSVEISDPLLPCQITNASQALTFANGLKVTALGVLPLNSLLGGIVQSIIAFQGTAAMQQITGSFALSNLAVNQLPTPTGTQAPLSVAPMINGLAFVSPEGLRVINFASQISEPIGDHGQGITIPFIYASTPTRIVLAATADVLRISVANGTNAQNQEWWYDLTRLTWNGPHTFPADQIEVWRNTFVMAPKGVPGSLWQSDPVPQLSSVYIENSNQLTFLYQTGLLPDNQAMAENAIVETLLSLAFPQTATLTVGASDESGNTLDQVSFTGVGGVGTLWDVGAWDVSLWNGGSQPLVQRQIAWHKLLVFKQFVLNVSGASAAEIQLGVLYLRYQICGYLVQ